ncbi:MAG: helix-hairpin-helix domain-containing protein [Anaerolineae bacterium]|nr:helix-hairpin-helix domain-containing protein [Anaerolineae bacterium]
MVDSLVKINSCSISELTALYKIGPELAERITNYRDSTGYFTGPEDLSKVEGISMRLAMTLSPHIDWQIPNELTSQLPEDSDLRLDRLHLLALMLLCLVGIMASLTSLNSEILPSLNQLQAEFQSGGSPTLNKVLTTISGSVIYISGIVVSLALIINIITNGRFRKVLFRMAGLCLSLTILSMLVAGIGNTLYYLFSGPDGIYRLSKDGSTLMDLSYSIAGIFFVIPIVFAIWKPYLIDNRWLAQLFDISPILVGIGTGLLILSNRNEEGFWFGFVLLPMGAFFILFGIRALVTGRSLFQEVVASIASNLDRMFRKENNNSNWHAWINARLPNPDDQIALQHTLNNIYKPSITRTLFNLFVIAIGSWLVLTVLGAIIEWIVQGWLERIFPFSR